MPRRVVTHRSAPPPGVSRHRDYDRAARDPEAKRFYDSKVWRDLKALKLAIDPICEPCRARSIYVPATVVHHVKPRREYPSLALDLDNLASNCDSCHSRTHALHANPDSS